MTPDHQGIKQPGGRRPLPVADDAKGVTKKQLRGLAGPELQARNRKTMPEELLCL